MKSAVEYGQFVCLLLAQKKLFASCSYDLVDPDVQRGLFEDLKDYSNEEIYEAIKAIRKESPYFPSPDQIIKKIKPKLNTTQEATIIALKIWGAIPRFGFYRGNEAKEALGNDVWETICQLGGWSSVCEVTNFDEKRFKEQCEVVAVSIINKRSSVKELPGIEGGNKSILQKALSIAMSGTPKKNIEEVIHAERQGSQRIYG